MLILMFLLISLSFEVDWKEVQGDAQLRLMWGPDSKDRAKRGKAKWEEMQKIQRRYKIHIKIHLTKYISS